MSSHIKEIFPEIREVKDDKLRAAVIDCFQTGLREGVHDSLYDVPWAPHHVADVGEQGFVPHVRDVTQLSQILADRLSARRDVNLDMDYVIAGALLHDVSKLVEHDDDAFTDVRTYLEHPHFCIYILETADIPLLVQHIAIAHTPNSGVDPKTIEASIVHHADVLAMDSIFVEATGSIK